MWLSLSVSCTNRKDAKSLSADAKLLHVQMGGSRLYVVALLQCAVQSVIPGLTPRGELRNQQENEMVLGKIDLHFIIFSIADLCCFPVLLCSI